MRKRPARRPTRPFSQTMPLPPSFTAAIAQLQSLLRQGWSALRQFLATRTRRQWWQAAACVPVFLVLLLGVLVWQADAVLRYANATAVGLHDPKDYIGTVVSTKPVPPPAAKADEGLPP